jgi:hypothetical protein
VTEVALTRSSYHHALCLRRLKVPFHYLWGYDDEICLHSFMGNGNASAVLPVPPLNNNMPSSVSSQKLPVGAHIVVQGDKERFVNFKHKQVENMNKKKDSICRHITATLLQSERRADTLSEIG